MQPPPEELPAPPAPAMPLIEIQHHESSPMWIAAVWASLLAAWCICSIASKWQAVQLEKIHAAERAIIAISTAPATTPNYH